VPPRVGCAKSGIRAWDLSVCSRERRKEEYSDTHDLCQKLERGSLLSEAGIEKGHNAAQKRKAVT
jgi:hypothetical protein